LGPGNRLVSTCLICIHFVSGFGHFIAKRLADRGFTVFAGCYRPDGDGASALRSYRNDDIHVIELDVTDDDSVRSAVIFVDELAPTNGLYT